MLKPKRWRLPPKPSAHELAPFASLHPILAQILHQRGWRSPAEAEAFLRGDPVNGDPFKLHGMAKAVARIRHAIRKGEKIVVYGDFDADGVTSTALLVSVLRALGADVQPYIPHRVDEGYGLNDAALIGLARRGFKLCITVDCGIRSVREVQTANAHRLDMIITDHHSVGPELPPALAVINPKQVACQSGESMLAGVGVTFRLAQALLKIAREADKRPLPLQESDLLDLVAIGTVADLVPLNRPENRALALRGIAALHQARRPGVRALLKAAGIAPEAVDATSIGFAIGPRLNAAGRLESAMKAYQLLMAEDEAEAAERAAELNRLNARRQELTRALQEHARKIAALDSDAPLIFAADSAFAQGVVGLVASRLTEEYYRPSVILHQGQAESHGSCRSIPEFNITEALDACADLLVRHGGHAQAAGFTIYNENLPAFRERLTAIAAAQLGGRTLQPTLEIDAELELDQLSFDLYESLQALEPCGNSFPQPIFCARNLRVLSARAVGTDAAHLQLRLSDGERVVKAIAFNFGKYAETLPPVLDIAFQIVLNEWNGEPALELNIKDLRPAG
ncbi:MAG: single-stranded-DNA-specific exonuclease RecJ [Candidatus Thermofonsia Clade 1 bacterium]|uniref:Single-stranded-DNA-specific exonuclease RecJ n=1 Tax=Candidatus Thermofonsia Clade 1 bacterium TaxID=2364210 RepID=A0A2M8PFS8_9CHLR|nr:MAG: single-stranded-DNA-specific exonuclease RecJ [Candidatus Thermofonsia Clade 1 bacterium]RMF53407.1 MAG: single-stranded-DNA-specific exonuclease RecJ [Chloroflexota bacterium]